MVKSTKYRLVSLCIFFVCFLNATLSQQDFDINELKIILNGCTIYRIDEDQNGNIWLATNKGVYEYDGTSMHAYKNEDLIGNEIIYLKCDTINDRVWVKNIHNEIGYIHKDQIKKFRLQETFHSNSFIGLGPLQLNKLIISRENKGEGTKIVNFYKDVNNLSSLTNYTLSDFPLINSKNHLINFLSLNLFKTVGNNYFFESKKGIHSIQLSKMKNEFEFHLMEDGEINYFKNQLYNIHQNLKVTQTDTLFNLMDEFHIPSQGNIVRAINDGKYLGLCKYNFGIELFDLESRNLYSLDELDQYTINDFFQDSRGILWFGTQKNGLIKIKVDQGDSKSSINFDERFLKANYITVMDSSIYLALLSGEILKSNKNEKFSHFFQTRENIKGIKNLDTEYIALLSNNYLAIITKKGEIILNEKDCIKDISFSNSRLLITNCDGIIQTDIKKIDSSIFADQNFIGRYYHATTNDTFCFVSNQYDIFPYSFSENKIINDSLWGYNLVITDIELDKRNQLWVATSDEGLYFRNVLTQDSFSKYNKLPTISMGKIKLIEESLFLFCKDQTYLINVVTKEFISIQDHFNLKKVPFIDVSLFQNEYIFTSKEGVFTIPKSDIKFDSKSKSTITIRQISSADSIYSDIEKIKLDHDYSNLTIKFATQDFSNYQPFAYHYKLFFDNKLIREKKINRHDLYLSNLRSGEYRLHVSRSPLFFDEDNYIILNIDVAFPFWQQWWFLFLSSLFLVFISASGYRYWSSLINKKKINQAKIKNELDHLKLTSLQEKLNPHFINNILNTSQYYISFESRDKASNLISKLSTLMRSTFDQMKMNSVSLSKELKFISEYTRLQNAITKTDINFTIDTGEFSLTELDKTKVPVYLIQPVIENAIKHNLNSKKLNIELSLAKKGQNIFIIIKDDGIGVKMVQLNDLKSSLEIIAKRLAIINGNELKNINFENTESNFIVTLMIKLNSSFL